MEAVPGNEQLVADRISGRLEQEDPVRDAVPPEGPGRIPVEGGSDGYCMAPSITTSRRTQLLPPSRDRSNESRVCVWASNQVTYSSPSGPTEAIGFTMLGATAETCTGLEKVCPPSRLFLKMRAGPPSDPCGGESLQKR
jgi:hypothetical protein